MEQLEVTSGCALRIWWALTWRTAVFGGISGFGVGLVCGLVGIILGVEKQSLRVVSTVLGYAVGLVISYFVLKYVIKKGLEPFKIIIVAREPLTPEDNREMSVPH